MFGQYVSMKTCRVTRFYERATWFVLGVVCHKACISCEDKSPIFKMWIIKNPLGNEWVVMCFNYLIK